MCLHCLCMVIHAPTAGGIESMLVWEPKFSLSIANTRHYGDCRHKDVKKPRFFSLFAFSFLSLLLSPLFLYLCFSQKVCLLPVVGIQYSRSLVLSTSTRPTSSTAPWLGGTHLHKLWATRGVQGALQQGKATMIKRKKDNADSSRTCWHMIATLAHLSTRTLRRSQGKKIVQQRSSFDLTLHFACFHNRTCGDFGYAKLSSACSNFETDHA